MARFIPTIPAIPVIPPLPPDIPNGPADPNPVVAICGQCGLNILQTMCYSCSHPRCPTGLGGPRCISVG